MYREEYKSYKRAPTILLQVYMDSLELEKEFLAARAEIETGSYEVGDSDEEQTTEVSGMTKREELSVMIFIVACQG